MIRISNLEKKDQYNRTKYLIEINDMQVASVWHHRDDGLVVLLYKIAAKVQDRFDEEKRKVFF